MKSRQAGPSLPSVSPAATAPASAGMGNGAAQEVLKKRVGGGTWTVQSGDTLSRIASRRYGNAALWESIRDSNPDRVRDGGHLIYVGTVLDVPEIDVPALDEPAPEASALEASALEASATGGAAVAPAVEVVPGGDAPAEAPATRTTDFGTFEIYPDAYLGPLPRSHDGVQVVRRARFAELEAEAAAALLDGGLRDPDVDALAEDVCFDLPVVVTLGGEQVRVSSKAEAQHAARMFREIREVYGIRVDSQAGVDAIKARYTQVPKAELDKLTTKEWEYKEVLALHTALGHFAPVLGNGSRGVKSVSKVDQAIEANDASAKLDTITLGEYLPGAENLSLFTAGTNSTTDFADNQTQLEATAIHEVAHGLLAGEVEPYAKATGFWKDVKTKNERARGAEQPITSYGRKSAAEDLSEATMYYFIDPDTLRSTCPIRHAYLERVVSEWPASHAAPP